MIKNITTWLLYFLLVTLVLTVEQVYGLPLAFFAFAVLAAAAWGPWFKQAWLLIYGILLAALYGLPLAGGVILLTAAYSVWLISGTVFKNIVVRLWLVGGGAALSLALVTRYAVTPTTFVLLTISTLVLVILTRIFVFVPEPTGMGNFIRQFREVRIKTSGMKL